MPQCVHLDPRGRRCQREADEGLPFCRWHDPERQLWPSVLDRRRLAFRLAALILLAIFLIPLAIQGYRLLKTLLN